MRILPLLALSLALSLALTTGAHAQAEEPEPQPPAETAPSAKQEAKQERIRAKAAEQADDAQKRINRNLQDKRGDLPEGVTPDPIMRDIRKKVAQRRRASGNYQEAGPRGLTREERGLPPLPSVPDVSAGATPATEGGKGASDELTAPGLLDREGRVERTPEQVAAMRRVLMEEAKHRRRAAKIARLIELAEEADQPIRKRELANLQALEQGRFDRRMESLREDVGDGTWRRATSLADVFAKGRGRKR